MDKELYTTKKVTDEESGKTFMLEYYITEDEMPIGDSLSVVSYGVEIVLRSRLQIEASRASFLFTDKQQAASFAELLANTDTFPVSLSGIVEDLTAGQEIPQSTPAPKVQCFTATA